MYSCLVNKDNVDINDFKINFSEKYIVPHFFDSELSLEAKKYLSKLYQ